MPVVAIFVRCCYRYVKFTIMYKNFTEYWETKKEVLEKLGVTRDVAKMIWDDAVDCLGIQLLIKELGK